MRVRKISGGGNYASKYGISLKRNAMSGVKKINTLFYGNYTHHYTTPYPSFSDVNFNTSLEFVNYKSHPKLRTIRHTKEF